MRYRPRSPLPNDKSRVQDRAGQNRNQIINSVIQRVLPTYRRNTYHNRGEFFWTKQAESETPQDFWRRLIEVEKNATSKT